VQYFNDHQYEQQPVNREDKRGRVDVFLRIPPERDGGTPDTQQCGERKQQAKSHVGEYFNPKERPTGQLANPRDILIGKLVTVHYITLSQGLRCINIASRRSEANVVF
jgi:hypothetical protein